MIKQILMKILTPWKVDVFSKEEVDDIIESAQEQIRELLPERIEAREDLINKMPVDMTLDNKGNRVAGRLGVFDAIPGDFSPGMFSYISKAAPWILLYAATLLVPIPLIHVFPAAMAVFILSTALYEKDGMMAVSGPFALYGIFIASVLVGIIPVYGVMSNTIEIVAALCFVWFLHISDTKEREEALKMYDTESLAPSMMKDRDAVKNTIQAQARASLRDTSKLVVLGKSTGFLRRGGDPLTPDVGGDICMSLGSDIYTHLLVTGETGTGKTSCALKPLVRQLPEEVGAAILDGKGALAIDMEKELDRVVTPDNTKLNLLLGVEPEVASEIIYQVSAANSDGGIWDKAAENMVRQGLFILKFLSDNERGRYDIKNLYLICTNDTVRESLTTSATDVLSGMDTDDIPGHVMAAVTYWEKEVPSMPNETRGSVIFNVSAWLNPMVSHPTMRNWAGSQNDIDIPEEIVHGKKIGVAAPPFMYGRGGVLGSALIQASLLNRIRRRAVESNWKEKGETDVVIVMDEFQELVSSQLVDFIAISRSLRCAIVGACQTVDQLLDKLGGGRNSAKAESFVNQFRSRITFMSSKTTLEWAARHAGVRHRWKPSDNQANTPFLSLAKVTAQSGLPLHMKRSGVLKASLDMATGIVQSIFTKSESRGNVAGVMPQVMDGQLQHMETITSDELNSQLITPFSALVVVNRAGAKRREICDLTPDFAK